MKKKIISVKGKYPIPDTESSQNNKKWELNYISMRLATEKTFQKCAIIILFIF